jgi:hypothetical protein
MNTDLKGELCENIAIVHLMKMGFVVSKTINKCRYDLLVDVDGRILKMQVKKATIKENYIEFRTASVSTKNKIRKQYTNKEIDYFIIVDSDNDIVYIMHVDDCSQGNQRLRTIKAKNNQEKNILFAEDFLLKNFKL